MMDPFQFMNQMFYKRFLVLLDICHLLFLEFNMMERQYNISWMVPYSMIHLYH